MKPPPYIFFGSSRFSFFVARKLFQTLKPQYIITLPPEPQGRGLKLQPNTMASFALKEKIPFKEFTALHTTDAQEFFATLCEKPNGATKQENHSTCLFGVLSGFGKIVPPSILHMFERGILNAHPSLLPRHRGPSPIQWTILNANTEAGVTIIEIDEEIDHGPIVAQQPLALSGQETTPELEEQLGAAAGALLAHIIPAWLSGETQPVPQDHTKATWTRLLKKEDGLLTLHEPAETMVRKVRAFDPWPGTFLYISLKGERKLLKVFKAHALPASHVEKRDAQRAPGHVFALANLLCLKTTDGALSIEELQLEGRKRMSAQDFLNGHSVKQLSWEQRNTY